MKNLIVASTGTLFGGKPLEYLSDVLIELYKNTEEVVFLPYARPGGISYEAYVEKVSPPFEKIGKKLVSLHTFRNPVEALTQAKGAFTGGGNTFVLVKTLYELQLMQPLRESIFKGLAYLGTSAGSNICGVSMQTTNDMPIVYPPSFKTLGVIPFNLNPHYLDPDPSSQHMGETRETRIQEFHSQNTVPVVGLREGSWLRVQNQQIVLMGSPSARIFTQSKSPYEIETGTDLSGLF